MTGYSAMYELLLQHSYRYVVSRPLGPPEANRVRETWAGPRGDLTLDVDNGRVASVLCWVPDATCRRPGRCLFSQLTLDARRSAAARQVDLQRALGASLTACESASRAGVATPGVAVSSQE